MALGSATLDLETARELGDRILDWDNTDEEQVRHSETSPDSHRWGLPRAD